MNQEIIDQLPKLATTIGIILLVVGVIILALIGLGWLLMQWYRHKDREKTSLESVLLQVAVPRDNEIKIDVFSFVFCG